MLPGESFSSPENGMGLTNPPADRILVVGYSTGGTAAALTSWANSALIPATLGHGAAVDMAGRLLDAGVAGTVDILSTAASVAASVGSVTRTGTGPLVTAAGTPTNDYGIYVSIKSGGALGVATFSYTCEWDSTITDLSSLNISETITVPAGGTFLIPNTGITLTFPAGTYVAGDTYTLTAVQAMYNSTDLSNAMATINAGNTRYKFIVFAGQAATSAAGATIAGAISGFLTTLRNAFKWTRAIVPTGKDTAATVVTSYASLADSRIMLVAESARVPVSDRFQGWGNPLLPFTIPVAARASRVKISTSPAWVGYSNEGTGGALPGVTRPSYDESTQGEVYNPAKINAPRTYPGSGTGIFLTNSKLKSASGSDFKYWEWGLVVDLACAVIYDGQLPYVNGNVAALTDGTGRIDPRDAERINADIRGRLDVAIMQAPNDQGRLGHCSGYSYAVDQTTNVLSSGTLLSNSQFVPFVHLEQMATTVALATKLTQV